VCVCVCLIGERKRVCVSLLVCKHTDASSGIQKMDSNKCACVCVRVYTCVCVYMCVIYTHRR